MLNPYESPAVPDAESIPTSFWRSLIAYTTYLVSFALTVAPFYGVYNLHSRGWPHPRIQTFLILLALGVFILAASGFAFVGIGIQSRRRGFAPAGVAIIGVAVVAYLSMYALNLYALSWYAKVGFAVTLLSSTSTVALSTSTTVVANNR